MTFIESILNEIDPQLVEGIAREAGVDKIQVERAARGAVPVLLNAFSRGLRSSAGETFLSLLELGSGQKVFDDLMYSLEKHALSGVFPLIQGLLGKDTLQKLCATSGLSQNRVAHLLQGLFPAVLRVLNEEGNSKGHTPEELAEIVERERDRAANESPEGALVLSYALRAEDTHQNSDDIFAFGAQMMVSLLGTRR